MVESAVIMNDSLPGITGFQLIRLLERDDWVAKRRSRHGQVLSKFFPKEGRHRVTVVQRTRASLPTGTLAGILSEKQTGIGRHGLSQLIRKHGLQ
jgi:predicted RNA binding protein YcfA (HicA-like mRNA interferase family)